MKTYRQIKSCPFGLFSLKLKETHCIVFSSHSKVISISPLSYNVLMGKCMRDTYCSLDIITSFFFCFPFSFSILSSENIKTDWNEKRNNNNFVQA